MVGMDVGYGGVSPEVGLPEIDIFIDYQFGYKDRGMALTEYTY